MNKNMEKKGASGMLFSEFFTTSKKDQIVGGFRASSKGSKFLKSNLKQPMEKSLKFYENEQNSIRRKIRSSDKTFLRQVKRNMGLGERESTKFGYKDKYGREQNQIHNRRIKSNDKDSRKICRVVKGMREEWTKKGFSKRKEGILGFGDKGTKLKAR